VNQSGRTRTAEARYKLSQDGEAVTPTSSTPESAPRTCSRHARSARRDGAAVLADCSSSKGKLSVWLVLRIFSMEGTVYDLSGWW